MKRWGVVAALVIALGQVSGVCHAGVSGASGTAVSGGAAGDLGHQADIIADIICIHPVRGPFIYHVEISDSFNKVTLNWRLIADSACVIYRRTGTGKQLEKLAEVKGGSYVDRTVKPGEDYVYSIRWAERSVPSLASTVWVSLKPGKVKGVKARGIRRGLSFKWKKTKNVTGYQIQLAPAGKKKRNSIVAYTKKNRYCRKNLGKGQKYTVLIRAYKKVKGKKIYGPSVTKTRKIK